MSFDPIRDGRGQPRVACVCDVCGRREVVAAVHGRSGREGAGQAVSKIQKMGWTYLAKCLRCPKCEGARKMASATEVKGGAAQDVRGPSRAQRLAIVDLLQASYDTDAGRYKGGDADQTVADVLGVMPGWVAEIREDFFGPDGGSEDIAALQEELAGLVKAADATAAAMRDLTAESDRVSKAVVEACKRLDKIARAVGEPVRRRAGVK